MSEAIEMDMKRYVADMVNVRSSEMCDLRFIEMSKCEMTHYIDTTRQSLVMSLDSYFHAIPEDRIEVHKSWPEDWWQAFRERWFPAWWLQRHPVQYTHVDIDRVVRYGPVCPHLHKHGTGIHLQWMASERIERVNKK